ncbi:MAG TPA: TAXI family TRAP transporter solute-binding subunit [Azospirillaceae bacterium]|nr:TAXI family TRAP transporter solute-binding subunit [Azospirillaceae bacterium]
MPPHLFPLRWLLFLRHGLGLPLAFTLALSLAGALTGWAQELKFFRIGTGTTGGTYFPIGGLLSNAISNPPGSRPCGRGGSCGVPGLIAVAQATSGSVENINALRSGGLEAALVQADIAHWAFVGQGIYRDKPPFAELRAVANLYTEAVHLVVRADSPIRSVRDLAGRAVSLGDEGSGILVESRILLAAYGLSESAIRPFYLRPGPSADRLAAGELDAFFMVGGFPVQAITDLAARVPIRLIPFDDEPAVRLKGNFAYYTEVTIDADAYPGVPGTRTLGVGAQFVVRSELPADLAYGITAALWHESTLHLLAEGHPKGRGITLPNALQGLAVPLHPGAERFYREVGLLAAK